VARQEATQVKITRINHMAYNVAGVVAEARDFYTRLLGLPEVPIQFPGGEPMMHSPMGLWIEQGGVQMHLIGLEKTGEVREPQGTHVSWYVDDLDAAIEELRAAGIEMRELRGAVGHIVWIADPAGNTIELQQDPDVRPS
jgi:catechol 2,3-dioxygenase-like lactoylglutathione lyase family enzyme